MKPRDYCCCAIPLFNAGIYTTLTEQFVLGILAGTLSVGTTPIVGASTPSAAKWIFAVICYAGAAIQLFGFFGVAGERTIMYRRYVTLHQLITLAAFSVAAVWIAISASRHSQAKAKCRVDFFTGDMTSEGDTLCDIFPWVDIGLMGGLWVLLAIVQLYLCVVLSSYGSGQRIDHQKYDSMYEAAKPLANNIPMSNRGDPWNARLSSDSLMRDPAGYHSRQGSDASVATVLAEKVQQPDYAGYPSHPGNAYVQEPGPTPRANDNFYTSGGYSGGGMEYPERSQPHPGGSCRRRIVPTEDTALAEALFRGL